MFIGSTSDHLIHHVQCPVLVVKDESSKKNTVVGLQIFDLKDSSLSPEPVPASLH